MRKFKFIALCLAFIVLALSPFIIINYDFSDITKLFNKNSDSAEPANATPDSLDTEVSISSGNKNELRAVWISYFTLDMEGTDYSENSFKKKFDEIVKTCKETGFNALIVQVRPFSDALYNSSLFPISHIVSGTQGKKINFDPLKYMCSAARDNNMQIHAWINPYRISSKELSDKLSKDNPYIKNNALGIVWEDDIYYDPSQKEVRKLITSGVEEIVKNYDIDGIQFDDYFYPTEDEAFDSKTYNAYLKSQDSNSALSLAEWRYNNVNLLIADCYNIIKSTNSKVVFGVSPQGNLDNNEALYADVKLWCREKGYIDYICPQIYFSLENPALTFENSLNSWTQLEKHKDLKMYVGLAGYKAGSDKDSGTWKNKDDILKSEIEIIRNENLPGFMLFSYDALIDKAAESEIKNVIKLLE